MSGNAFTGGKEELRAAVLKPYLLRVKEEKGDVVYRQLLTDLKLDSEQLEGERAWLSQVEALAALRAIAELLGLPALRQRGKWTTHPESLGTMVRMLRTAKTPIDAYRYLITNAKESTRVGTWELAEPEGETPADNQIKLSYKIRTDADDLIPLRPKEEKYLCDARRGELASYPLLWGMPAAEVTHAKCIARGDGSCDYAIAWKPGGPKPWFQPLIPFASAGFALTLFGLAGTWLTGVLGAVAAGGVAIAALIGVDRLKKGTATRIFEDNQLRALERGLDLKGDANAAPVGELVGTVLGGKYRIGRKIGSGGIGVVYAAEHTTLGHEVAVKVLRGAAAKDASEIARLRREAKIQTHIEHPNVARVFDLDQMPDGSIYLVMERLLGRSLADVLARQQLVTPGFAVPVFVDVCRALSAAHGKGVVHRDLKPGNIFLCQDKTAKVLDFGMSKLVSAEALTQQGFTLGTPEYMAPEQCIGAAVEARTDLYALGVLMYESLAGELPITAANRRDLLDLHQRKIPTSLRELRPELDIPVQLDEWIMRCLEKRAGDRPASALELGDGLAAISLEGLPLRYAAGVGRRDASPPAAVDA
jgi:eukaryotic-like serine/threonine-protein kinase